MSILTNVSILANQITLIIKWMSILANPFARIFISSWMSILTIKDGQNQMTLIIKWMSIRANVSILSNPLQEYLYPHVTIVDG